MNKLLLFAIFLVAAFAASAEEESSMLFEGGNQVLLFDVTDVKLEVSDQVKDGCMPQPNSVNVSAEAALRRNKFSIVNGEDSFWAPSVQITVLGYAHSDYLCAIFFSLAITKYIGANVPHTSELDDSMKITLAPVRYEVYSTVLTGPKNGMQDRIEREAEKAVNDLFITIERSKDYVKGKWPKLWRAAYGSSGAK